MTVAEATASAQCEIDHAGERFRQHVRWSAPFNAAGAVGLVVLHFFYPHPLVIGIFIVVAATLCLSVLEYRLAGRGHVREALLLFSVGMWLLAIVLGLGGGELIATTTPIAVLPVIVAIPYFTPRALLVISLIAAGVAGVSALFAIVGAPLPVEGVLGVRIFIGLGATVAVAVCATWLWHACGTLGEATERTEQANEALRESERTLEERVRERTTALEQSEQELAVARDRAVTADQQKSAFLARMSHELRTPLNAIIGFSEVLLDEAFGTLNDKQAEYTRDVHDSGQHLLSLINDILDLSKVETGQMELSLASFSLPRAIENALTLMKERAAGRGITLHADLDGTLDALTADERKVKQVLINLLTNAVKFTPEGGSVTIRVRTGPEAVTIEVEDTGIGIPAHEQGLVFEDYRQATRETTNDANDQEGTGLGLPLARKLVELHGGRIWVTSTPDQGSTFAFTIPVAMSEEPQRSTAWQES
jgi:signal transduction histidine kinase